MISPLFVDRFGRYLRICHLDFDMTAIYDGFRSENAKYRLKPYFFWILMIHRNGEPSRFNHIAT